MWSTGRNFGRLSFPLIVLSVSRFLDGGEIDLALIIIDSKNQFVLSMVPIHSRCHGHLVISILPMRSRRLWSSCKF